MTWRLPLLSTDAWTAMSHPDEHDLDDDATLLTGIQDGYHDLLVGPCDPEAAEVEAQCPLVCEIGIGSQDDFDCTYEQWGEHFREQVHQAAQKDAQQALAPAVAPNGDTDLAERLQQAQTTGLEDGSRIEARGDGWVVIDRFYSFLLDPEDASWVAGEDDEDIRPAFFPTAEAAYGAWLRSEEVAEARAERCKEALDEAL